MRDPSRPSCPTASVLRACALAVIALLVAPVFVSEAVAGSKDQRIDRVRQRPPKRPEPVHGLARDLDEYRARGLGTVPAPALQAYLDSIADRLLDASGLPKPEIDVHLVTDVGFGATVTPDGNVFVDMRLLRRLEDEDAMAGVLAHELAHVLLGHADKAKMEKRQEQLLTLSKVAISANREVALRFGTGVEVTADRTGRDYQDIAYRLNRDIITPGWGRKQELQADELATDLLAAAGYDPMALLDYLGLLADQAADSEGMLDAVLEARTELIGESLQQFTPETPDTGNAWGNLLAGQARDHLEKAVARQLASVGKSHPDPQKRIDAYMEYVERDAFAGIDVPRQTGRWTAALEEPASKALLANYDAAFALQSRLGEDDVAALEALAEEAVRPPTSGHPFPRFVFHQLRIRQGMPDLARQNLVLAVGGPEPSGRVTTELATIDLEAGRREAAAGLVEAQFVRLSEAEALYPLVIRTRLYTGKQPEAMAIAQRCGSTSVLGKDCQRAYQTAVQELAGVPAVGAGPAARPAVPETPVAATQEPAAAAEPPANVEEALNDSVEKLKKGLFGFGK